MSSLRILVVDDEPSQCMTLSGLLEQEGCEVQTAGSGPEALELVMKTPPHVILSDIQMPGMNGVELLIAVRGIAPELRVVLMTAFAQEDIIERALMNGVFTILRKPMEIDLLMAILRQAAARPAVLVISSSPDETLATLRNVGNTALSAVTAVEAMDLVQNKPVDLCVVDLELPDMPGHVLITAIRAAAPQLRFLGFSLEADGIPRALAAGALACLRRPLDEKKVVRFVAKIRGADRAQERLRIPWT